MKYEVIERKKVKYTLLTYIGLLILLTAWIILIYVGYQLYYPFKISELKSFNIQPVGVQGENLNYHIEYCKYDDRSSVVMNSFVNSLVYAMPPMETNVPIGCRNATNKIFIPKELPPGVYHIRRSMRYRISPFRSVEISYDSNNFTVLKGEVD